jgi:S1-C subfamily serine protease
MRKLLNQATMLLTCFMLTITTCSANDLDSDRALQLIRSTVRVNVPPSRGSGVILWTGISPKDERVRLTYVITNYHVVGHNNDATVDAFLYLKDRNSVGSTNYTATVVLKSRKYDLALIEIKTDPKQVFSPVSMISAQDWDYTTLYEPLYLVSCGLGASPYITNGHLSSIDLKETKMGFSAPIIFGSSGGGIYNEKGELVGIGNAIQTTRGHPISHHALGIPITTVKSFIKKSKYKFMLKPEKFYH